MQNTIVLYPAPGIGHIISMVELGKLLLHRHHHHHHHSFSCTIFITTGRLDSTSIDSYIHGISQSYPSISFLRLPFVSINPSPPRSRMAQTFDFIRLSAAHAAAALTHISKSSKIEAFIIDFFCINSSLTKSSASLNTPVFYFFTSGAAILSAYSYFPKIDQQVNSTNKSFKDLDIFLHLPGNPPLKASQIVSQMQNRDDPAYNDMLYFCSHIPKSNGILVNTFEELEPVAVKAIQDAGRDQFPPVYYIGPLIAEPKDRTGTMRNHECLKWLDKQPKRSVVYLCFGSRGTFSVLQLKEIATAMERSEQRFLWVLKKPPVDEKQSITEDIGMDFDLGEILPSGFMERTKEKGMVVRSWAPQVEVLSKESVGGFVTHCGWNSVLEAVVAGVPMIAWPLYSEQHMNRNELVEDMKIAIGLEHREEDGFVSGEELEKKVRELMESEKGREIRDRSFKMKEMAATTMAPDGSSTKAMSKFVEGWNTSGKFF